MIELKAMRGPLQAMCISLLLCLITGYSVGMRYLYITSDFNTTGVEENYLGNEDDEDAEEMKFAMPEAKLLTIIHTHILSYAFIFSILGVLILMSSLSSGWKTLLVTEPFLMSLLTFGGIYFLWDGIIWMKYLIMLGGIGLSIGFYLSALLILKELLVKRQSA